MSLDWTLIVLSLISFVVGFANGHLRTWSSMSNDAAIVAQLRTAARKLDNNAVFLNDGVWAVHTCVFKAEGVECDLRLSLVRDRHKVPA